jgi:hypothetical protein
MENRRETRGDEISNCECMNNNKEKAPFPSIVLLYFFKQKKNTIIFRKNI